MECIELPAKVSVPQLEIEELVISKGVLRECFRAIAMVVANALSVNPFFVLFYVFLHVLLHAPLYS